MLHDFAVLLFPLCFPSAICVTLIAWRGLRYVTNVSRRWHGSDCLLAFDDRWSIGLPGYAWHQSDATAFTIYLADGPIL